jgi:hypothetical protein
MSSSSTSSRSSAFSPRPGLGELLLELGNAAVGQLAGRGEVAARAAPARARAALVELLLDLASAAILSRSFCQRVVSSADCCSRFGELVAQRLEPVLRGRVLLLAERRFLDLELDDPPVEPLDLLGLALDLHADPARRLVHQVDRLVGQEALGDVAVATAAPRRPARRR